MESAEAGAKGETDAAFARQLAFVLHRKTQLFSQRRLALLAGCSQSTIARIELRRRRASPDEQMQLSLILGVPIAAIFDPILEASEVEPAEAVR